MNDAELATLTAGLPELFADRIAEPMLEILRSYAGAGEWGEELDLLVYELKQAGARVGRDELDKLRTAFTGWEIPTGILDGLNVAD